MVVIDLDCMTGLQSTRILADRGLKIIGVAQDTRHYACRSNRLASVHQYERRDGDLLRVIESVASSVDGPVVLLPCADWSVLELSRCREGLPSNARIVLPAHETIQMLMDKGALNDFAASVGVSVPTTVVVEPSEVLSRDWSDLTFPVVVKPARKSAAWDRAIPRKVVVADNEAQLSSTVGGLGTEVGPLIVQEWIPGGEDQLFSCNLYIDRRGEVLCTFVARKLRQWPPHAGTSASGESVLDDRVSELAADLFSRAGHIGLGYVEMKYDSRSDSYVVIEPNVGRPTGRSAIADGGGVALLYTAYCDAVGTDVPWPGSQQPTTNKWVYLRHDVQAAVVGIRRGELTLGAWLRSLRGPKTFAVWSVSDPVPFLADLAATVVRSLRGLRLQASNS